MKDWKRKLQILAGLFPAVVLLICISISLSGYTKPVFEVGVSEKDENTEESSTEETVINKNKTVELPPTTERSGAAAGASKTVNKTKDASAYKNGVYYGTGTGFGGKLKVKVTIKKERINKIEVVESKDGESYMKKAAALLDDIIKKQSTNVDVVSGATYSSVGLIEAVRDALKDAVKDKKDNKKNAKNEKKTTEEEKVPAGRFPYNDGVYYGTGEGYRGDITVAVSICSKTIQYILITESSDDDAFLSKAKALLDMVVKKQSTDVDVVSGATYSSKGIIEAINNALAEAKRITDGDTASTEAGTEDQTTESKIEETTTEVVNTEPLIYADGDYTADVTCSPDADWDFEEYTLSLKITVKNDRITSVTEVKGLGNNYDTGNDWYIARAVNGTSKYPGTVKQITTKGKPEGIDTVSGATCSSKAVIEAVKKALESAKILK